MKQFYAGAFFYNSHSKKVLLHKRDENTENNPHAWTFFEGLSKRGETPVVTAQRELYEELRVRVPRKAILPLYDYFNEDMQTHRYVFYVHSRSLKEKLRLREGEAFAWMTLEEALKQHILTDRARQDLVFFQRELTAKYLHLPTAQL